MIQNKIEKSICVLKFSRKYDDWKYWSCKFLTKGIKKSYRQVVDGTQAILTKAAHDQAKLTPTPSPDQKRP